MIVLGRYNTLKVLRKAPMGLILGDEAEGEVLLPNKFVPPDTEVGGTVKVFVYLDHEQRPIATTLRPKIVRDEFALLRVRQVSDVGAFMDWGLEKDLLVPFREQEKPLHEGKAYIVFLYLDPASARLVGSTRRRRFLEKQDITLEFGQEVDVLVCEREEAGLRVIVDNQYAGMVYYNELFKDVRRGERVRGYVKQVRPDGNVDVSLQPLGLQNLEPSATRVMAVLAREGGFLPLTDASSPEEIQSVLEMSKKTFKKAIGVLYKAGKVRLEADGIHAVGEE